MYNMKPISVSEIEQNIHCLEYPDGRRLYLIGTAHVSRDSVDLVEKTIESMRPDVICVELDEKRLRVLEDRTHFDNMDLVRIIRSGQTFFFIGQFILSSFQKKIAEKTDSPPGAEFRTAVKLARETNAKLVLADRDIGITLKRAWRITPFMRKMKMLVSLIYGDHEQINEIDFEEIKRGDAVHTLLSEFAKDLPETKKVLIDERDQFLAHRIVRHLGRITVAVVGAGHIPGIIRRLSEYDGPANESHLTVIPPVPLSFHLAKWLVPVGIVLLFAYGFFMGNYREMKDALFYWIVINGSLSALGCVLALAHPLTVVIGFIAAPITSMNPTIGAGFVTGIAQTFLSRPRIRDIRQIQEKALTTSQWWKNRITKVFLVFVFSSLGSGIGTWIAIPFLTRML